MIRPKYETAEHLEKEEALKKYIEKLTSSNLEKLPIKYYADFMAFKNGTPVSIVETKVRSNKMNAYPTYMISLHKIVNVLGLCELLNVPFVLFVEWTDAIGCTVIDRESLNTIGMQPVNFRDDTDDIEPCVFIPIELFKKTYDKRGIISEKFQNS